MRRNGPDQGDDGERSYACGLAGCMPILLPLALHSDQQASTEGG
jgi:hypothetical protein